MRRQRARWRWLLWESRGYQARGTTSVLPSSSTTLSSSSVTLTSTARTLWRSLAKEAIPTPQQFLPMALHQLLDLPNLRGPEAPAGLKDEPGSTRTSRSCHLARHEHAAARPYRRSRRTSDTAPPTAGLSARVHPNRMERPQRNHCDF